MTRRSASRISSSVVFESRSVASAARPAVAMACAMVMVVVLFGAVGIGRDRSMLAAITTRGIRALPNNCPGSTLRFSRIGGA